MAEDQENTETTTEDEATPVEAPETAAATEEAPAAEATPAAEPEEQLAPKERRQRERQRAAVAAGPQPKRTPEERAADRIEKRRKAAASRTRWRAGQREKRRAAGQGTGTPPAERSGTGSPRVRQGIVVSDKSDKTIIVAIAHAKAHRTYGKIVRTSSKLSAHDERNEAGTGDTVRLVESRPLSATKRWRLVEILERAR
jgi:small subunit ribosomal protein S17